MKKNNILFASALLFTTLLTPVYTVQAAKEPATSTAADKKAKPKKTLYKRVKGVFRSFTSIFSKKKSPTADEEHDEKKEKKQTQPANLRTVIASLQSAAIEGPEIYSLVINDSIDRLLEKAEAFAATLRWGGNEDFISQLASKAILEKNKASLLLQMKIWETYLDDGMPFKSFIQELTKERLLLDEYDAAIIKLSTNEWFKNNETLDSRTKKVLASIKKKKQNLEQLNCLILELLNKPNELTDPNIFRILQNNLAQQQIADLPDAGNTTQNGAEEVDLLRKNKKA